MKKPAKHLTRQAVRDARGLIRHPWESQANLSFFLALIVLGVFILPAMGFGIDDARRYSAISFTLMLISGVAIAWGERQIFILACAVAVPALAVRWLASWSLTPKLILWDDVLSIAAVMAISFVLLWQVFRPGPVTAMRIQGAIAVYLLFGMAWAHCYHIADILHPGSFSNDVGGLASVGDWAYYSFITLTTVGYGDITPVRPIARVLAIGEAVTGQLYLAVLVARLVALGVISWQAGNDHAPDKKQPSDKS